MYTGNHLKNPLFLKNNCGQYFVKLDFDSHSLYLRYNCCLLILGQSILNAFNMFI